MVGRSESFHSLAKEMGISGVGLTKIRKRYKMVNEREDKSKFVLRSDRLVTDKAETSHNGFRASTLWVPAGGRNEVICS